MMPAVFSLYYLLLLVQTLKGGSVMVSQDSTRIVEPRTDDGFVDDLAALNGLELKDVIRQF